MLTIRLQRIGKKKQPNYRVIISEKSKDTQGNNLEILGYYNPLSKDKTLKLKEERIKYWLSNGAQTSNTVHNLLVKVGVLTGKKRKAVVISKKRQAKLASKKAEKEEKTTISEKPVDEASEGESKEKIAEETSEELKAEKENKKENSSEEK